MNQFARKQLLRFSVSLFKLALPLFCALLPTPTEWPGSVPQESRRLQVTRDAFAREIAGAADSERRFSIHFLSVWDTVSTIGWVWEPRNFVFTANNPSVRFTRHAMAIDERRVFFRQNRVGGAQASPARNEDSKMGRPNIIQCWFAGSHCDAGGGHNLPEDHLWPLSFGWMLDEARACGMRIDQQLRNSLPQAVLESVWTAKRPSSLVMTCATRTTFVFLVPNSLLVRSFARSLVRSFHRRLGINARDYLLDVLPRLADWPVSKVSELPRPPGSPAADPTPDQSSPQSSSHRHAVGVTDTKYVHA